MKKYYALFFAVVLVDQLSKFALIKYLPHEAWIAILGEGQGLFNIVHVTNTGIAFSAFSGYNSFFLFLSFLIVIVTSVWTILNSAKLTKIQTAALTLIVSGGTGNLIDRIFRGAVVDFLDFGIGYTRWPAFNVADSAVCIGAALLVISIIFQKEGAVSAPKQPK